MHDVPSQTSPPVQGGPAPHRHCLVTHWLAAGAVHAEHAAPPAPQWRVSVPDSQTSPLQQPEQPEVVSHRQVPPEHRVPAGQAALPPQVHAPVAEHPSATRPQSVQSPPAGPHLAAVRAVRHALPSQQPAQPVVASHLQVLATHCAPGVQEAPAPHRHEPALQPLDSDASQTWHCAPFWPHAAIVVPSRTQTSPWQQPVGQDDASQAQEPPEQTCPERQAALPPQVHAPEAEQPSARSPQSSHAAPGAPQVCRLKLVQVDPAQQPPPQEAASQTHPPAVQCWPAAQAAFPLQLQAPAVHPSARTGSQPWHAPPPGAQAATLVAWQPEASQQPPAQEVASQTHPPAVQCSPTAQGAPPLQPQSPEARHSLER